MLYIRLHYNTVYIYIYIYTYILCVITCCITYTCVYIYIERERGINTYIYIYRERERSLSLYIYIYIEREIDIDIDILLYYTRRGVSSRRRRPQGLGRRTYTVLYSILYYIIYYIILNYTMLYYTIRYDTILRQTRWSTTWTPPPVICYYSKKSFTIERPPLLENEITCYRKRCVTMFRSDRRIPSARVHGELMAAVCSVPRKSPINII